MKNLKYLLFIAAFGGFASLAAEEAKEEAQPAEEKQEVVVLDEDAQKEAPAVTTEEAAE